MDICLVMQIKGPRHRKKLSLRALRFLFREVFSFPGIAYISLGSTSRDS